MVAEGEQWHQWRRVKQLQDVKGLVSNRQGHRICSRLDGRTDEEVNKKAGNTVAEKNANIQGDVVANFFCSQIKTESCTHKKYIIL